MPAKFVLKKGSTGKFRFNLVAPNGQVIATSETYETKRAAQAGIDSVKKNAGGADVDDQTAPATRPGGGLTAKKAAGATKSAARKTTGAAKRTAGAAKKTAKKAAARTSAAKKTTRKSTTRKTAAKKS